jgi:glycosyltransferase involved in cell wall biosynthesis
MEKKKILYIITKANYGGAQRYVCELACAMQMAGHTVEVAAGGTGELTDRLTAAGIKTHNVPSLTRDIGLFREIKALYSLFKIIRTQRPDIVHLNSGKAGAIGAVAARVCRVPRIVFTAHGWSFLEPRPWWWKTITWLGSFFTALLAHHVILVSKNDLRESQFLCLKNKSSVIYTGVPDFPVYPRLEARSHIFTPELIATHAQDVWLVTHGEINHNKNHAVAIDAVAEFNSENRTKIFYTIIGSGDLLPEIKEQVALRGLNEYVHFTGQLTDPRQYLEAFDMYLIPSRKEGLPYALLEAGAVGLPAIASNVGGIPEVVEHGVSGILTSPQNHMSIVGAFSELIQNPDLRTDYADNLKTHVRTRFSLEKMIVKTEHVYNL